MDGGEQQPGAVTLVDRSQRLKCVAVALAAAALAAIGGPAVVASACVSVASLTASPASVQPGATVTVIGGDYVPGFPVQIHLDVVSGPILATVASPTGTSSMTSRFAVAVTLPSTLSAGQHLLIATQNAHNMTAGIPARALIAVGTAPRPTTAHSRRVSVVIDNGPGVATLIIIAASAAIFGLLILAGMLLTVGRRPRGTGPARA